MPARAESPAPKRRAWPLALSDAAEVKYTTRASALAAKASISPGAMRAFTPQEDRKSTRLNSSHLVISYAVFCLKKKKNNKYGCTYDRIFSKFNLFAL